ncbi:hypothetical protein ACL02S_01855 [Nocardia sp. 004]|uniref:hypothetical protein n=1 Tax=Nocardia sp. 004 TaxID=3385978 RepID=UPI0039A08667
MNYLFVLHDPPYGTERTCNGIRWAAADLDAGHAVRRLPAPPAPQVSLREPSCAYHPKKERDWLARWNIRS